MEIHRTLAALRKEHGYTQPQVAQYFCDKGCPLTNKAISRWEIGASKPDAEQFLLLCELYGIRDVLHVFGGYPVEGAFSALNADGKRRAQEYIALLAQSKEYGGQPAWERRDAARAIPLYDLPVSAGTGQFLDSDHYELIEVDESAPPTATFAVRVRGDSMAPRFVDRQVLYIRQQQTLADGDFGIFMLNGEAYCKKLMGNTLTSLNVRYQPIPVGEDDEFRIIGKVVG